MRGGSAQRIGHKKQAGAYRFLRQSLKDEFNGEAKNGNIIQCLRQPFCPIHISSERIIGKRSIKLRRSGKLQLTMAPQPGDVRAISYSPDGKLLASGDVRGWICIFNMKTGEEATRVDLKNGSIFALDWKPDGSQIAVATNSGSIFLIDSSTGNTQRIEAHSANVRSVCYSPDGKRLVSGSDDNTMKM